VQSGNFRYGKRLLPVRGSLSSFMQCSGICSCITDCDLPTQEQQRNKKNKQASAVSPLPRRARSHQIA